MPAWSNPERWQALCSGDACPICRKGRPLDVVVDLEASWLTMQEHAAVRGYACLVARTHAVDLHDLPPGDAAAFMRDAQRVSRVLADATCAVKMNYEIHGNTLPHLHMHFYPRFVGDAFEGVPIDPLSVPGYVYDPGEFTALRAAVLRALG